jgi:hypothetical protein
MNRKTMLDEMRKFAPNADLLGKDPMLKYNEDQLRDEHGRFGSGSGGDNNGPEEELSESMGGNYDHYMKEHEKFLDDANNHFDAGRYNEARDNALNALAASRSAADEMTDAYDEANTQDEENPVSVEGDKHYEDAIEASKDAKDLLQSIREAKAIIGYKDPGRSQKSFSSLLPDLKSYKPDAPLLGKMQKYSEDQERDENGRWTSDSGTSSGRVETPTQSVINVAHRSITNAKGTEQMHRALFDVEAHIDKLPSGVHKENAQKEIIAAHKAAARSDFGGSPNRTPVHEALNRVNDEMHYGGKGSSYVNER